MGDVMRVACCVSLMEARARRNALTEAVLDSLAWCDGWTDEQAKTAIEQICCQTEDAHSSYRKVVNTFENCRSFGLMDVEDLWQLSLCVAELEVAAIPDPKQTVPWHLLERLKELKTP